MVLVVVGLLLTVGTSGPSIGQDVATVAVGHNLDGAPVVGAEALTVAVAPSPALQAPPLLGRLAALAVLLGAAALLRRVPRSRAPTAVGGSPTTGLVPPTPARLLTATPGLLRV